MNLILLEHICDILRRLIQSDHRSIEMYKVLINEDDRNWKSIDFNDFVDAWQCVRIHHHTRLVYPCGAVAEYVQGSLIDLR